jgi:hypothetical protein
VHPAGIRRGDEGEEIVTEWIAELDWAKTQVGQKVRLVNADGEVTLTIVKKSGESWVHSEIGSYYEGHWNLFVEAPLAVVLPTEPGFYSVGRKAHPYERLLVLREQWFELSAAGQSTDGYYTPNRLAEIAVRENRLTRLEPVPETAKKVLDRVRDIFGPHALMLRDVDAIAAEFGVKVFS